MANKLVTIFKDKEIRTKLFYTILALVIFRLLTAVPAPGLDKDALKSLFEGTTFGQMLALVTGVGQASILAIGIGPYINASIIIQLLTTVVPQLEQLSEEGSVGQQKLSQYTRFLTVPLAVIQSFVIYTVLRGGTLGITIPELDSMGLVTLVATLTAGAIVLMWVGEVITEYSLTNGISLIIGAGVLLSIPNMFSYDFNVLSTKENTILYVGFLGILLLSIFINEAVRKINIQYSSRVRGGSSTGGGTSHLPLKLNQSGVMPVIFAFSLLSFPSLLAQMFTSSDFPFWVRNTATWFVEFPTQSPFLYNTVLLILILAFSLFYMFVVFKPDKVAENLKKQGGFISGIRPGQKTEEYLVTIMWRLGIIGGLFLAFIAVMPTIASNYFEVAIIGVSGTGLLILVSVVLDMLRTIDSLLVSKSYSDYK